MKSWYLKICLSVFFSLLSLTWIFAEGEEVSVDLLLYKGPHWMNALAPEQIAQRVAENPKFQAKYDRRYRKGDIVEVRPGGSWTGRSEKTPFYTVTITGLSVEAAKKYMKPLYDTTDPNNPVLIKRRKWRVLVANVPSAIKQELQQKGVVTVSLDKVKNYIKAKLN